nr:MAG TPA: hypothetical protein [Caudoviricetes sp.]
MYFLNFKYITSKYLNKELTACPFRQDNQFLIFFYSH